MLEFIICSIQSFTRTRRQKLPLHIGLLFFVDPESTSFPKLKMDSNRQGGIHHLLSAEQEAQNIVNAARNAKLARLKQAKDEADTEIGQFRAQTESQFQNKVSQSSGDSGANVKRLEQETEGKIHHLQSESSRISQDVVDMLLRHVTTVKV